MFPKNMEKKKNTTSNTNESKLKLASAQNHLEFNIDGNLLFHEHKTNEMNKETKGVDILCKLQSVLSRPFFHTTSFHRGWFVINLQIGLNEVFKQN